MIREESNKSNVNQVYVMMSKVSIIACLVRVYNCKWDTCNYEWNVYSRKWGAYEITQPLNTVMAFHSFILWPSMTLLYFVDFLYDFSITGHPNKRTIVTLILLLNLTSFIVRLFWCFVIEKKMKKVNKIQSRCSRLIKNNYELRCEELLGLSNDASPHQRCLNCLIKIVKM